MKHYYSEEQTSELNLTKIDVNIKNLSFKLYSGSGVFSKKKLDKGTETLLKYLSLQGTEKVLDLGCGIGVVGIYAKKMYPEIEIYFSDINRRAVMLTKKNLELNNISGTVKQSDSFKKIDEKFDVILLNPPQVAGKEVCFKLISDSKDHLNVNGSLQVVARHNKGGKTLSEHMKKVFGNMEEVAKGSGYRIYLSRMKN